MGDESQELAVRQEALPVRLERKALEVLEQNIALLEDFTAKVLVPDVDYGRVKGIGQPFLQEPGASKIINAFKCYARHRVLKETVDPDQGLISYIIEVELVSRETDKVVGTGIGTASTTEGKYGLRWVDDPEEYGIDPEGLRTRTRTNDRTGEVYTSYRIQNPDWGDLVHTLLSMASKRAETDAAKGLPGVSTALVILFAGQTGPEWRGFWVDMRNAGLSPEQVHDALGVVSVKDFLARGKTLEEARKMVFAKYARAAPAPKRGQTPGQPAPQPKAAPASVGEDKRVDTNPVKAPPGISSDPGVLSPSVDKAQGERFSPGEMLGGTPPAKWGAGQAEKKTPRQPRDIAAILTLGDALTACWEDFRVDRAEAARRCGLADHGALTNMTPVAIYQQVAGVEG